MNFGESNNKIKDIYENIPLVKQAKRKSLFFRILRYFNIFVIAVFVLFLVSVFVNAARIKTIYDNSTAGKKNIEHTARLLRDKNYPAAADYAAAAENNFSISSGEMEKIGKDIIISHVPYLSAQIDDVHYLLSTAEMLSRAAKIGSEFGLEVQNVLRKSGQDFTKLSNVEKRGVLDAVNKNIPELNGIKANVDLASMNLARIEYSGLLFPFKKKLKMFEAYIDEAKRVLDDAVPLAQISLALAGYPDKSTFLLLLQNSDELRPTGGFIGTYGIIQTENSDILRMDTHDIYHMDMPVKDMINVTPPAPLKEYLGVDKWFMRDSNWSPDFVVSASTTKWFYGLENKLLPPKDQINKFDGEFDGVIAVTPKFVTDLLEITGPIRVENQDYDGDNFMKLLEYRVEKGYVQLGVPEWHRKEVIGEIMKELKIRLFDKSGLELYQVFNVIQENLSERNLIFNFTDSQFQEMTKDQKWSGEVLAAQGDSLMIIDANMAALKTDAVINRSVKYVVNEDPSGLFSDLYINYAHRGGFDWRTTRYRSYTRVYVPAGSVLIDTQGIEIDKVKTYQEFGKTVFAFFVEVEPGAIKNLHFYYELPDNFPEKIMADGYALYIQKQPGSIVGDLTVDLNFLDKIQSFQPASLSSRLQSAGNFVWEGDLMSDRSFNLFFKEQ